MRLKLSAFYVSVSSLAAGGIVGRTLEGTTDAILSWLCGWGFGWFAAAQMPQRIGSP